MCVILGSPTGKLVPEAWIRAAWDCNDHGGGMAWRSGSGTPKAKVHFKKGFTHVDEMVEFYKNNVAEGTPHALHFRIASVGPRVKELTHPFLITEDSPNLLEGSGKVPVLFHNGTLTMWKQKMEEMSDRSGGKIKIPAGPWSDSRAMAFMAFHRGVAALEFFDEKLLFISPDRFDIYSANYQKWVLKEGIFCSNTGFDHKISRFQRDDRPPARTTVSQEKSGPGALRVEERKTLNNPEGESKEVSPDNAPFRQSETKQEKERMEVLLRDVSTWPKPPRGKSKRQMKRWRKKMEKQGLLPSGPERHAYRNFLKYYQKAQEAH